MKRLYTIFGFLCLVASLHGMEQKIITTVPVTVANPIKLQFSDTPDGDIGAILSRSEADMSGLLKDMLEAIGPTDSLIPLPAITKAVWQSSIAPVLTIFLKLPVKNQAEAIKLFLDERVHAAKTNEEILVFYVNTLNAADYLDIPLLIKTTAQQLSQFLRNHSDDFLQKPSLFSIIAALYPEMQKLVKKDIPPDDQAISLKKRLDGNMDVDVRLAIGSKNGICVGITKGNLKLWDLSNPKVLLQPTSVVHTTGDSQPFSRSVIISPDETTLFSTHSDNRIRIWNSAADRTRLTLISTIDYSPQSPTVRPGLFLALSSNAKTLYCGAADGIIQVWNVSNPNNPQQVSTMDGTIGKRADSYLYFLTLSTDGTTLYCGFTENSFSPWTKNSISLWDVTNRADPRLIRKIDGRPTGFKDHAMCVPLKEVYKIDSFIPGSDGRTFTISDSYTSNVILLPIEANDNRAFLLSPSENIFFINPDTNDVVVWDFENKERPLIRRIIYQSKKESVIAISPDKHILAKYLFSEDLGAPLIDLWFIDAPDLGLSAHLFVYAMRYKKKSHVSLSDPILLDLYEQLPSSTREGLGY